ncbi:MAG TPA: hypothetical protein VGF94_05305 [Kofleriaceae bacterium]|jgi:hypothetical protein
MTNAAVQRTLEGYCNWTFTRALRFYCAPSRLQLRAGAKRVEVLVVCERAIAALAAGLDEHADAFEQLDGLAGGGLRDTGIVITG